MGGDSSIVSGIKIFYKIYSKKNIYQEGIIIGSKWVLYFHKNGLFYKYILFFKTFYSKLNGINFDYVSTLLILYIL